MKFQQTQLIGSIAILLLASLIVSLCYLPFLYKNPSVDKVDTISDSIMHTPIYLQMSKDITMFSDRKTANEILAKYVETQKILAQYCPCLKNHP